MRKTAILRLFALILTLLAFLPSSISCAQGDTALDRLKNEDECVFFINVGRGDAILIRTGKEYVLIDAGSDRHKDKLRGALEKAGVTKLAALIVTHGNGDHADGVKPLTEYVEIEKVYCPKFSEENKDGKNKLKKKLKKLGLDVDTVEAGDKITVGGTVLDVLAPSVMSETDENDNSVVVKCEIGGVKYLFTGDMEFEQEKTVFATGADLDCDVLKVPNHGHADATSDEFASLATPKVSIVTTSVKEDNNTASMRVRDLLRGYGEYHVTEDSEVGILVYADAEGNIKVLYV